MATIEQIDRSRVPQHVAIIMDGNGRWAMRQQHQRLFGHQNAMDAVRAAVEAAVALKVGYLTLYTFSTENWNRPQDEVDGLMELLITADPDLLIRTGGELRVSNFLLWQMAYTEFYFTDLLWPDFRHEHFYDAVLDYQQRQRRFGKTEAQVEDEAANAK